MAFDVLDPTGREAIVLRGPWDPRDAEPIRKTGIASLWVNYALGFAGNDLDFLDELPQIRTLNVIDRRLENIKAIERMPRLEVLLLQCAPAASLDLEALPTLSYCALQFGRARESVLRAKQLRRLRLHGAPFEDFARLSGLTNLQRLALISGKMTRAHGAALSDLSVLELVDCRKIEDLTGLGSFVSLQRLDLDRCRRIVDLNALADLPAQLQELRLADVAELESIKPLAGQRNLQSIVVVGDTRIADGDLSPLLALPRLVDIRITPRRHYRPSADEVKRHFGI